MIHPSTIVVEVAGAIGDGVVATAPIPRGTVVWARDTSDVVLSVFEVARLEPQRRAIADRYGYRNRWGATIICSDAGRLVNHSCEPTIRGISHDAMIAVRDIAAGEEVTCDYAECNLDEPMRCACGTTSCRVDIRPDDLRRYSTVWDAEVLDAVRARPAEQPVVPFAVDPEELRAVLDGRSPPLPLLEVAFIRS